MNHFEKLLDCCVVGSTEAIAVLIHTPGGTTSTSSAAGALLLRTGPSTLNSARVRHEYIVFVLINSQCDEFHSIDLGTQRAPATHTRLT